MLYGGGLHYNGVAVNLICLVCHCRQEGADVKKKQAECLKKLGEVGLESGPYSHCFPP